MAARSIRSAGSLLGVGALALGALAMLAPFGAQPAAVAQMGSPDAKADAYDVDATHSSVLFRVMYMNSSHFFGRFNEVSGSFLVDPDNASDSFLDITVETSSVDSGNDGRDKHLRSPDFFNATQFPDASFKSTRARRVDGDTIAFIGDFTLRGKSSEVTVEVDLVGEAMDPRLNKPRQGFLAKFTFDRLDYGVSYGPQVLSGETELIVSITGVEG